MKGIILAILLGAIAVCTSSRLDAWDDVEDNDIDSDVDEYEDDFMDDVVDDVADDVLDEIELFGKRSSIPLEVLFSEKLRKNIFHRGSLASNGRPRKIDLLIAIENAYCKGYNYKDAINFIKRSLNYFSVSPGTTRVGVIKFNRHANTVFSFDKLHNRQAVKNSLTKLSEEKPTKLSQSTSIISVLKKVEVEFKKFTRPGTKRILLILTACNRHESAENWGFAKAMFMLKRLRVERHILAINHKRSHRSLARHIPSSKHYFYTISAETLKNTLPWIAKGSGPYNQCDAKKKTVLDECNRRCTCVNGLQTSCQRVRKEWNSLSKVDQKLYINTFLKLTSHPTHKPRYDEFIRIHRENFDTNIHEKHEFLPWHRWFIMEFENLMKEVDCRVTATYWDWSMVAHDPLNKNYLFHPDAFGTVETDDEGCVKNGPFRKGKWSIPNGECLKREADVTYKLKNAAEVEEVLRIKDFHNFEEGLRINLHNPVHCSLIGGTMCYDDSATAPIFFPHHTFIDKLWNDGQQKKQSFSYGLWKNSHSKMQKSPYSAYQVLDLKLQPGFIKVVYSETKINNARAVKKTLAAKSTKSLEHVPSRPSGTLSKKGLDLFNVSRKERKDAKKIDSFLTRHPLADHNFSEESGLSLDLVSR